MSSNNEANNQNKKNNNSYFLRTQSTILKGEKIIPFNSLYPKLKHKSNSLSKTRKKINTPKKVYNKYLSANKSVKTKRYLNSKKDLKNITTNSFGGIDLNKISGSSHLSKHLNYKNNRNIIPNESNGFSVYGTGSMRDDENENKCKNTNNYSNYLTNNNNTNEKENKKINNKNLYNSKLYTPFYDLIENINKNYNTNTNNNINNFSNNHFLNNNHIVEINNNNNNKINDKNKNNYNELKTKLQKEENNNNKIIPKISSLKNSNLNNYHQLKIETNDDINEPKEEFRTSIMEKTIEFLNNNKNNYNTNNINFDYNPSKPNNFNTYINDENIDINNKYNIKQLNNKHNQNNTSFKTSMKKNKNIKLTYNYQENKNNNDIDNFNYIEEYNKKYPLYELKKEFNNSLNKINKNREKDINENNLYKKESNISLNRTNINKQSGINENNINEFNFSLNKTNINRQNYNDNNLNNQNYIINNNTYINSNNNNNNTNKNKSFCNFEGYKGGTDTLNSKYFLKTIFDQNSTSKFVNDFNYLSPSRLNKKNISFINFDFINKEKKTEMNQTPRAFFNIQNSESRLEEMLKSIPTHKKQKKIYEFNSFSKKLNNNIIDKKSKKSYEEIDNIMPPNFLRNENNNN